jgi:signal transduction histidine kinase
LKTPLAVISANTEVILTNPEETVSGQSKWLGYIQSETMRMSKLITMLLSAARMDNSKNERVRPEPINLSETVANICLVFEPVVYEHCKKMSTVIQRNLTLRADQDDIRQLLSILMENAVLHSTPNADITVSLSEDAQNKIRLSVANTAKDIPPEQLAHLFDRFYRVDTEGSPNGSGLGLSIARSIVRQNGGNLTVSSENNLVTFVAVLSA